MKHFLQTLKYTTRLSIKEPTNTILCILVLAGSIALVASMFRLCHMAFFWSFPYENSDRIVMLSHTPPRGGDGSPRWTFKATETLVEEDKGEIFSQMLPVYKSFFTVRDTAEGGSVRATYIGWDFEKSFQIKPLSGRNFTTEDARPGAQPVALISEYYWREHYNADPDIIGKTIQTDKVSRTIIGVMPDVFDFPTDLSSGRCEMWLPYEKGAIRQAQDWVNEVNLYGIVKPGISMDAAERRFNDRATLLKETLPDDAKDIAAGHFFPINGNYMPEGFQTMIMISAASSLLVLLMGCGIVSGLLSARYSGRVQELAIRSALGASRKQIVGQILAEFSLIAATAVVLGLLLDLWMEAELFSKYYDSFALPAYAKNLNPVWVSLFVAGAMILVTLVSALLPAFRASQTDVSSIMRESTRTGSSLRITRLSNFIIVSQVALTCLILTCGLMIGLKIRALHTEEKFFDPYDYHCVILSMDPEANEAADTLPGLKILNEIESRPEVEKAGISTEVYNSSNMQWGSETKVWIDGVNYPDNDQVPVEMYRVVSPGYFASLNIPILAGRDFSKEDDNKHPNVVAVTDTFARNYFGTTDVLGRGIRMWGSQAPLYTIIAVVPDVYNSHKTPGLLSGFFVAYAQNPWSQIPLYVKLHGDQSGSEKIIKECINKVSARTVIVKSMNMGEMKDYHGWGLLLELIFTFFSAFAISALILAGAGLYGVIAFSVNMRRVEMGIRLALGADPFGLILHIARRGLIGVGIGLAVGALLTLFARNSMHGMFNQLYSGWEVYVISFSSMILISTTAVFIPAARGSTQEPATALREE